MLTGSHLRQVTQASQVPAAAPATEARSKPGFDRKGKRPETLPQGPPRQTHAELMSQMRQADEPLTVGGRLCACNI